MKAYKKIWFWCALTCLISTITGCESNIDLEPKGILSEEGYFKSVDDYEKALNALYGRFHHDNYNFWMDGITDDGNINHSWNWGYDLARGTASTASNLVKDKWTRNYISIQRANNVVNNIDRLDWPGGEQDADRNRIAGEARTIRCFFYLDQLCLFGRIMFYEKNPTSVEESMNVPQIEDPKEVFDFILEDLRIAIEGLPADAANKSKIGKPAARLLRARAAAYAAGYLSDKSYFQITLDETAELLKTAPTLGNFAALFDMGNENIDEVILIRDYNEDKKNSWGNFYNNSLTGYCVTVPVKALADAYEYIAPRNDAMPYTNKDPRFEATIYAPGMEIRGKYYNTIPDNIVVIDGKTYFDPNKDYGSLQDKEVQTRDVLGDGSGGEWNKTSSGLSWKKYMTQPETWSAWNNFIVFRYAEAYLLRAEALVETGGSDTEAKAMIKVLRDRAGNTNDIDEAIATLYGGSLLQLIRNERRVEMANEGLRIFDTRRWKILLEVMNKPVEGVEYRDYSSGTPAKRVLSMFERDPYTDKYYWWPIPQAEIDLNKGRITQNPGWN